MKRFRITLLFHYENYAVVWDTWNWYYTVLAQLSKTFSASAFSNPLEISWTTIAVGIYWKLVDPVKLALQFSISTKRWILNVWTVICRDDFGKYVLTYRRHPQFLPSTRAIEFIYLLPAISTKMSLKKKTTLTYM